MVNRDRRSMWQDVRSSCMYRFRRFGGDEQKKYAEYTGISLATCSKWFVKSSSPLPVHLHFHEMPVHLPGSGLSPLFLHGKSPWFTFWVQDGKARPGQWRASPFMETTARNIRFVLSTGHCVALVVLAIIHSLSTQRGCKSRQRTFERHLPNPDQASL